jgi:flagellar M-ring protein FliF
MNDINVNTPSPLGMLARHPVFVQLGLLGGVAAAVALGIAIAMWSRTPDMTQLYSNLAEKDAAQVMDALAKSDIKARMQAGGIVLVQSNRLDDARMKLAAQGLPKGSEAGYELMDEPKGFGVSQLAEQARFQRALEGELGRSISRLTNVESARVHLALPKQTAFVRAREQPTASVLVNLYPGRSLETEQIAAITHLVASSVPNLESSRVTIVDQKGRLLSSSDSTRESAVNATQFEFSRKLEESYVKRIEDILTPIVGPGGVRAQVSAELDFTETEHTQENYDPKETVVRSEQIAQESNAGGAITGGVPGALSNTPPGAASVPETTPAATPPGDGKASANATANASATATPTNSSSRATRNYEIDRTISHTRQPTGAVKRLSVAVVVDDATSVDEDDEVTREPRKPDEIERYTALVKEAIGFNVARGDTVNIINATFATPPPVEPLPDEPIWKQPWVVSLLKQLGAVGLIAALVFMVVKPVVRALLARHADLPPPMSYSPIGMAGLPAGVTPAGLAAPGYDAQLTAARQLTQQDPKRVAQVVKGWVGNDG